MVYNLIGEGTQKRSTIRTVVFPALAGVHTVRDATTRPATVKKKLQDGHTKKQVVPTQRRITAKQTYGSWYWPRFPWWW